MSRDFDEVRASFAASRPGLLLASMQRIAAAAWGTSALRIVVQGAGRKPGGAALIRAAAAAIAVAAAIQPLLWWMMPPNLKPTIPPYAFIAIAVLAAVALRRAERISAAWPASRVRGWLCR